MREFLDIKDKAIKDLQEKLKQVQS